MAGGEAAAQRPTRDVPRPVMRPSHAAPRPPKFRTGAAAVAAAAFACASVSPASAETRVRAKYVVTLAGFEVGTAAVQAGIDRASYDMNLSLRLSGLAKLLTTGAKGAATSRGSYQDARVSPSAYAINTRSNDRGQIVRFALAGGAVRQLSVEPEPKTKNIIPISEADKRGIVDPLSAVIMPVAGSGDMLAPSSCDRTLPVFDGRQRYDIALRYDRTETARPEPQTDDTPDAKGGYDGKLIVCKASYRAISGHRPGRESVEFMEKNKDMEVWLAPVAGTRALMAWKILVRTQVGMLAITASSFSVGGKAAGVDL